MTMKLYRILLLAMLAEGVIVPACKPSDRNAATRGPASASSANRDEDQDSVRTMQRGIFAMGTIVDCTLVFNGDEPAAEAAIEAAFAEIRRVESIMTVYEKTSPLSRLNASSGGPDVPVPSELIALIEKAKEISSLTEGKFDISFRAVGRLWDFKASSPRLPDPDELKRALPLVDYTSILLDHEKGTIRLARKGMSIGLGAIAKGYAVDRASALLRTKGYNDFIFYGGGDIYVSGKKGKRPWRVGIQNPRDRSGYFARFEMEKDGAVVTSGDYEKFFELDGKRYHHIIDPDTGYPAEGVASVTVIAKEAALADAMATGIFVLGAEKGMRLIESDPSLEGVIVDSSFKVQVSSGLMRRLEMTAIEPAEK